ncbi:MAG: acyltransferase [Clostridiales bacterium]|nr:acyltransferase [Clostridiales bacterium]
MEQLTKKRFIDTRSMYISDTFSMRQSLMGFAALWIYLYHVWIPILGGVPVLGQLETTLKYVGFSGVDIFFFLSGGGLVFSMSSRSVWGFYKRRLERILIPFLVAGIGFAIVRQWNVLTFLSYISGYRFYTKTIYGFLWYVPAILTLYLFFPLYYRFFSRSKRKTVFTAAVLAVWLTASILLKNTMREDLYGFTNRIPIFLLGVLCGEKMKEKSDRLPACTPALIMGILALGVVLSYLTNVLKVEILFPASNACFPNILITLGIVFLTPWLKKNVVKRELPVLSKFLRFFGAMSLEFYCLQELLLRVYGDLFGFHNAVWDNLLLFLFISALSYALKLLSDLLLSAIKSVGSRPRRAG